MSERYRVVLLRTDYHDPFLSEILQKEPDICSYAVKPLEEEIGVFAANTGKKVLFCAKIV